MATKATRYIHPLLSAAGETNPDYVEHIEKFKASIPVGFPGQPEDQSAAACFLLSQEARFICGSVLFVDGGYDAMLGSGGL